jgi:hypothetical protein
VPGDGSTRCYPVGRTHWARNESRLPSWVEGVRSFSTSPHTKEKCCRVWVQHQPVLSEPEVFRVCLNPLLESVTELRSRIPSLRFEDLTSEI